jgi:hypothetical protein
MTDAKASPGQPFRPPPAEIWNGMVAAGEDYNERKRLGLGGFPQPKASPRDLIKIKNMTGAARVRGSVFKIGAKVLTSIDREFAWFEGDEPEQVGRFCIVRQSVADEKIVEAQVAGVCLARVNVVNPSHLHALVIAGDYELESAMYGPVDLLWTPETTGVAECLVNLQSKAPRSLIFKTPGGGIAGRSGTTCSSAACELYYIDRTTGELTAYLDADDVQLEEDVFHIGSDNVSGNVYIKASESFGTLSVDMEDCM